MAPWEAGVYGTTSAPLWLFSSRSLRDPFPPNHIAEVVIDVTLAGHFVSGSGFWRSGYRLACIDGLQNLGYFCTWQTWGCWQEGSAPDANLRIGSAVACRDSRDLPPFGQERINVPANPVSLQGFHRCDHAVSREWSEMISRHLNMTGMPEA